MRAFAALFSRGTTAIPPPHSHRRMSFIGSRLGRAAVALALMSSLLVTATPASAATVADFGDLVDLVENCTHTDDVVRAELDGHIDGSGDPALTVNCDTVLDLNGHALTLFGGAVIAAGRDLTIIDSSAGEGLFTSYGSSGAEPDMAGIQTTDAHLTIAGGRVHAYGGYDAAAIGGRNGEDGGTVTITGGRVTARGGAMAAGIGGGSDGQGGTTTINGGEVEASSFQAGAGIGGGYDGDGGIITITGGKVTATADDYGAGIGGGQNGDGGTINITGGEVTASGGTFYWRGGAGIGGGSFGDGQETTIEGGTVVATGGLEAAGIGGGRGGAGGEVTISGGDVTAQGGDRGTETNRGGGAGIGGGHAGEGGKIVITGGAVTASGGDGTGGDPGGPGIGSGEDRLAGDIEISGDATVMATGGHRSAGIGGGSEGSGGTMVFADSAIVVATGGYAGAGIGGGLAGSGGTVSIQSGSITATGGEYGAGIGGGGYGGSGGTITIDDGSVTSTGGEAAAGIGAGYSVEGVPAPRGGAVTIGADASVVAAGWTAVGSSSEEGEFGTLTVNGVLRVPSGNLHVPDSDAGPEVSIGATGQLLGSATAPTTSASITGDGQIQNDGVIALEAANVEPTVLGHHFEVSFDTAGGSPVPSPVVVFAPSFEDGYRLMPLAPTRSGKTFDGWNDESDGSGADFDHTYDLEQFGTSADGNPVAVSIYATWTDSPSSGTPAPDRDDTTDTEIERVSGPNSVGTSIAASRDLFADVGEAIDARRRAESVVLATTNSFPDGLVAAPLAVALDAPLLLTPGRDLDPDVLEEINRIVPTGTTIHLVGGADALAPSVAEALSAAGYAVARHSGPTRYDTAIAVADAVAGLRAISTVLVATGHNHPDALGAGVAAAQNGGVVLLSDHEDPHPATDRWLADNPRVSLYAIGGPAARAHPSATPIVGDDRYGTLTALANTFFAQPTSVGIARGDQHQDALAGGVHQAHRGGPILATRTNTAPTATRAWIGANPQVSEIWIYGGTAAIAPTTVRQLTTG